jgi:hypothetical protein
VRTQAGSGRTQLHGAAVGVDEGQHHHHEAHGLRKLWWGGTGNQGGAAGRGHTSTSQPAWGRSCSRAQSAGQLLWRRTVLKQRRPLFASERRVPHLPPQRRCKCLQPAFPVGSRSPSSRLRPAPCALPAAAAPAPGRLPGCPPAAAASQAAGRCAGCRSGCCWGRRLGFGG